MDPRQVTDPEILEQLLFECLEAPDGSVALDRACDEHPQLAEPLRRAFQRLRAHVLVDGEAGHVPERLGRFVLERRIGEGGMGVVYLAKDLELSRMVAVKIVRPEFLYFDGARERFRREVEAVARLQHPNIVAVHSVGEDEGVPFFVMEFVAGSSASDLLASQRDRGVDALTGSDLIGPDRGSTSSWEAAVVSVVRQVALALTHAHARGVVHRDIKPSNLLIDTEGRPKLADFGLAGLDDSPQLTRTRSEIGSLPYMPPEVVDGVGGAADPRFDIYSLGVTLYELLSLQSPFLAHTTAQTRKRILDREFEPLRRLNPRVTRDLETVCLTMMESDCERRYATAADVVDELSRVLERRPVRARRIGWVMRAMRWSTHHRAAAAALALSFLLFAVVPIGFAIYESGVAHKAEALTRRANSNAYFASVSAASASIDDDNMGLARSHLEACPADLRGWEWYQLERLLNDSLRTLRGHQDGVECLLALGGGRLLSGSRDGSLRLWDLESGRSEVLAQLDIWVVAAAQDDDGSILWVDRSGVLHRYDLASREDHVEFEFHRETDSMAFDDVRDRVAVGDTRGGLQVIELGGAPTEVELLAPRQRLPCRALAFDDRGRLLVGVGQTVRCFDDPLDAASVRQFGPWQDSAGVAPSIGHHDWVTALHEAGGRLMTFDSAGITCLWDVETGNPMRLPRGYGEGGYDAVTSLEDGTVLAGGQNILVRLESTGGKIDLLRGHTDDIAAIAVAPDESWVATGAMDGLIMFWPSDIAGRRLDCGQTVSGVQLWGDDGRIWTASSDSKLRAWSSNGAPILERQFEERVRGIAPRDASSRTAIVWTSKRTFLLELDAADEAAFTELAIGMVMKIAWHPSTTSLYAVTQDSRLVRWDRSDSGELQIGAEVQVPARAVGLAVRPDGRQVAVCDRTGRVQLRHSETLELDVECTGGHTAPASALAYTTDSRTVVSVGYDEKIRFWDVATGEPARESFEWAGHKIESLALHPGGDRIATGAINDGRIALWSLSRKEPILLFDDPGRGVMSLVFARDGRKLIAGSWDGFAYVFDAGPEYSLESDVGVVQHLQPDLHLQDPGEGGGRGH